VLHRSLALWFFAAGCGSPVLPDFPDAASLDAAISPRDAAMARSDSGVEVGRTCSATRVLDDVPEPVQAVHLASFGDRVALGFTLDLVAPHALMARVGDGETFGAPLLVFPDVRSDFGPRDIAVSADGKAGFAATDLASGYRRVITAEPAQLGMISTFGRTSGCYSPMVGAVTHFIHATGHPRGEAPDGVDWARSTGSAWATTGTVGFDAVGAVACDLAVELGGNGGAVWGGGSSRFAVRAFRDNVPAGPTYTATVPIANITVVRATAAGDGSVSVIIGGDQKLYEIFFTVAGERLVPSPPVLIEGVSASDRMDLISDPQGNVTLAWYGNDNLYVRRKLSGVWRDVQLIGELGGMIDRQPFLRVHASGEVALLYAAASGTWLQTARRDSPTFAPQTRVKESPYTASMAYLGDKRILVAWPTLGDILGVYCED